MARSKPMALSSSWLIALVWVLALVLGWPSSSRADSEAQDWMRRMLEARKQRNYEGVLVYGRGEEMNSVQIVHRYQDGEEQERLLHLDGEKREILREGDKVLCILPGKETVELKQSLPSSPFSGPYAASSGPISEQYRLSLTGGGRVAGYDAVKLAVMAQDEHRYSYLLWLDKDSALLLKSLVLNKQGEVLERMQYSMLTIGAPIGDPKLVSQLRHNVTAEALDSTPSAQGAAAPSRTPNWRPHWLPAGFQAVPALLKRVGGEVPQDSDGLVYSDGMSTLSVFVERLSGEPAPEGASQAGATVAYARSAEMAGQRYLITVVGEVPLATAKRVAQSVQFGAP